MITNGLPAVLNMTLVPGIGKVVEVQVSALDGGFQDMSSYTYMAEAMGVSGERVGLDAWVDADSPDVVILRIPALEEGRYKWFLTGVTEDGEQIPLISGVFGAHYMKVQGEESVPSPNRRLVVRLNNEGAAGVARWVQTNRVDIAVDAAEKAAEGAINAKNEALAQLKAAQEFIDSFNTAISKAVRVDENDILIIGDYNTGICVRGKDGVTPHIGINGNWWKGEQDLGISALGERGLTPYIGENGNWCIGDMDTGELARGRDGIDGDTVRRILVDTEEDIPAEGDTCNGGFYYYVPIGGTRTVATGWVRLPYGGVFKVAGVTISASSAADAVEELAKVENETNVYAELDSIVNTLVRLTALEAGVEGNRITLETEDPRITLSGDHLTGGSIENPTEWAMYAWLEGQGDIDGEWVKVGEVDDIATTRTYGMVKLSTDSTLSKGAVVGKNAQGRLLASVASASGYGTGKLSGGLGLTGGGRVGLTEDDAFMVEPAGYGKQGTMAYSTSYTVDVPCIGRLATGAAGVSWATSGDGGAVLIASDMNDARTAAVPNAVTAKKYLQDNYVTYTELAPSIAKAKLDVKDWVALEFVAKGDSYTKKEVDQLIGELDESTYSKTESDTRYLSKRDAAATYIAKSEYYPRIVRISREAFDNLESRDPDVVYLVQRKQ